MLREHTPTSQLTALWRREKPRFLHVSPHANGEQRQGVISLIIQKGRLETRTMVTSQWYQNVVPTEVLSIACGIGQRRWGKRQTCLSFFSTLTAANHKMTKDLSGAKAHKARRSLSSSLFQSCISTTCIDPIYW